MVLFIKKAITTVTGTQASEGDLFKAKFHLAAPLGIREAIFRRSVSKDKTTVFHFDFKLGEMNYSFLEVLFTTIAI